MKDKNTILTKNSQDNIYEEIKELIHQRKQEIYHYANCKIVQTYWLIGKIIYEETEGGKYGEGLIKDISERLTKEFGDGFKISHLKDMRLFYATYQKSHTLCGQLSWSHYKLLIRIKDEKIRKFYEVETIENQWSVRVLDRQIKTHYYERIVSNQSQKQLPLKNNQLDYSLILKDPYIFEFLNLPENYHEKDLEDALLDNLTLFLMELGKGYAFIDRQKHIVIDNHHYYVDLVFFNTILNCYVLIDLKIGVLKSQDIGQMNLYVNYYDETFKRQSNNPPIGIILCANKNEIVVEYSLPKDNQQIYVSKYMDYLPTKQQFRELIERQSLWL